MANAIPPDAGLDDVLAALDADKTATDYERTKARLRRVCDKIEAAISKGAEKKVLVSLQPGFKATMGQQLNVVVEIPERQYRDTLFRAYIPLHGRPVVLDFFFEAEPTEADTLDDMERAIARFLGNEEISNRLTDYRDLARK